MIEQTGLVPPHSENIETCVLSALISFPEAYLNNEDTLSETLFYKPKHVEIYKAIKELFDSSTGVDMMTVSSRLMTTKKLDAAGGYSEISKISMVVSSEFHLSTHIKILREKAIQRDIITYSREMTSIAYDPNVDLQELLDKLQTDVLSLGKGTRKQEALNVYDVMVREQKALAADSKIESWVPCHINLIKKFIAGAFIILAARPSHGKSALMLDIAERQAMNGHSVAIFSLEMKDRENIYRIWQKKTNIHPDKIKSREIGEDTKQELNGVIDSFKDVKLYVDCNPQLDTVTFKAKVRRLVKAKGVEIVYIDYLQLMSHKGAFSKTEEVTAISRTIKEVAMELDIPIVALSQLNRKIEERPQMEQLGKLSDLRDSGSLEQDADNVLFLTNFDMVGLKVYGDYGDVQGKAMLEQPKARSGGRGIELLTHSANCMSWDTDIDNLDYKDGEKKIETQDTSKKIEDLPF